MIMKENRNEIEIQSTPERVWEVLTDLDKYPEWNPLLCRAEGKLTVGEKVNLTARSASNDMNLLCYPAKRSFLNGRDPGSGIVEPRGGRKLTNDEIIDACRKFNILSKTVLVSKICRIKLSGVHDLDIIHVFNMDDPTWPPEQFLLIFHPTVENLEHSVDESIHCFKTHIPGVTLLKQKTFRLLDITGSVELPDTSI